MEFYRRADACIRLGAPLYKISTLSTLSAQESAAAFAMDRESSFDRAAAEGGFDKTEEAGEKAAPIRERLARLKSEIPNGDERSFADFEHDMMGALEALERSYRSKELG